MLINVIHEVAVGNVRDRQVEEVGSQKPTYVRSKLRAILDYRQRDEKRRRSPSASPPSRSRRK